MEEKNTYTLELTAEEIKVIYDYNIESDDFDDDLYYDLIYKLGEMLIEQAREQKVQFGDIG